MRQININDCLESAVSIAWNELSAKADVTRSYGDIPMITCRLQELGQVFLNLLLNAAQAIKNRGTIQLTTSLTVLSYKQSCR